MLIYLLPYYIVSTGEKVLVKAIQLKEASLQQEKETQTGKRNNKEQGTPQS